jgi:hypothetical protein
MFYEISQEIFKQKLEKQLNFYIIYVGTKEVFEVINLKKIDFIPYSNDFEEVIKHRFPNKIQNLILFTFEPNIVDKFVWAKIMNNLKSCGYLFIYFYQGKLSDNILDKGLN